MGSILILRLYILRILKIYLIFFLSLKAKYADEAYLDEYDVPFIV